MAWKPSKDSIVQEEESWTPPSGSVVSEEEVTPEEDQVEEEEPSMTKKGVAGAVVRGVSPTAAQAGAGALLGIPFGPPGMAIGAAGGVITGQLADLTIDLVNSNFGTNYSNTKDAVTHVLNKIGVPEAESSGEKIIQAVTEGAAQMGGGATALGALSKATTPAEAILPMKERIASEEVRRFTKLMGQRPVEQALTGAAAGGAMEAIEQGGGGALAQLGGGLATGIAVPMAGSGLRGLISLLPRTAAQKAKQAEELAASAYQGMVFNKKQALDDLARSQEVSDAQVRMMTGDITGDPGLLAMQDMLERESNVLASRKLENIAGMSRKLGEGLAPVGASPEETQGYFKSVIDNIVSESEKNRQAAIAKGDMESAKLIEEANAKASAIKAKADQNVLSAEEAFQQIKDDYQNLFTDLSSLKESTVKDRLSESAFEAISRQKDREKIYINDLYDAAEREVPEFFQRNTAAAKEQLVKEFGEERRLPNEVKKILSEVQDAEGNLQPRTLNQLRADIRAINSEIRAAQSSAARQAEVPALIKFKEALNKDIESLEGGILQGDKRILGQIREAGSENLKKANRAYFEYAQRYKEGASGDVFGPKALTSKTLDQFIKKSEGSASPEEIKRLRAAIIGKTDIPNMTPDQIAAAETDRATAIQNVSDWVISKMSGEVKGVKTSQSIENWLQTKGNRILEVFPESRPRIAQIQNKFRTLEDQVKQAQNAVKDFKAQRIAEGEQASLVESQANAMSKEIQNQYNDQVKKINDEIKLVSNPNSNPAAAFIGGNPQAIISQVMSSSKGDIKNNIENLVNLASKDETGKALEGLKNSVRGWMNIQSRSRTGQTVERGIPSEQVTINNYKASLEKMRKIMEPGSDTRNALELIFGKDSPELATTDKVIQQLNMMSRETALGTSAMRTPEDKTAAVKDNVLSLVGMTVGGLRGFVAAKSIDVLRKIEKNYGKEVLELYKNMLVDSMTDPELASKLLLRINEENFPTIQRVFADYGIKNLKASDFGLKTTEPEPEEEQEEQPEISFQEE
jgi:hypothetical protein